MSKNLGIVVAPSTIPISYKDPWFRVSPGSLNMFEGISPYILEVGLPSFIGNQLLEKHGLSINSSYIQLPFFSNSTIMILQ